MAARPMKNVRIFGYLAVRRALRPGGPETRLAPSQGYFNITTNPNFLSSGGGRPEFLC
jgi:hypothetical protein